MSDADDLVRTSHDIAAAIARRDIGELRAALAPDFLYRTPGGARSDAEAFLHGIEGIPGEILFVRIKDVTVDLSEGGALVTGIQDAQVRIDGQVHDDRRAFVDWFVKRDGRWLLRAAVDLPARVET